MHKLPENLFPYSVARLSMLALPTEESLKDGALDRFFSWADGLHDLETDPLKSEAALCHAPDDHPAAACDAAPLREDEIGESLPVELALENVKNTHAGFIVIPGAFDQEGGQ